MTAIAVNELSCDVRALIPERTLQDAYFVREFSGDNDAWKQPQRDRILAFLLKHHAVTERMRFFGFPSAWWTFEKMLFDNWTGKVYFTGIEKSWQVIEYGIRHMPGTVPKYTSWTLKNGEIIGFESDLSRMLYFHAEHFWGLGRQYKSNRNAKVDFARKFKSFTCAWIDTWYPIRGVYRDSLNLIGGHFDMRVPVCPLAISFPIGRDECAAKNEETTLESRVRVITEELNRSRFRRFHPMESFEYRRSEDRAMGMGTLMGLMIARNPDARSPFESDDK